MKKSIQYITEKQAKNSSMYPFFPLIPLGDCLSEHAQLTVQCDMGSSSHGRGGAWPD